MGGFDVPAPLLQQTVLQNRFTKFLEGREAYSCVSSTQSIRFYKRVADYRTIAQSQLQGANTASYYFVNSRGSIFQYCLRHRKQCPQPASLSKYPRNLLVGNYHYDNCRLRRYGPQNDPR